MKLGWQPRKWLDKKSKLGFRGYRQDLISPGSDRSDAIALFLPLEDRQ
jgi:hypothetical protein